MILEQADYYFRGGVCICTRQKLGKNVYHIKIGRKLKCTYVKSLDLGDIILPFMLKITSALFNNVSLLY